MLNQSEVGKIHNFQPISHRIQKRYKIGQKLLLMTNSCDFCSNLDKNFTELLFPYSHPSAKFCPNLSSFRGDISENIFQTQFSSVQYRCLSSPILIANERAIGKLNSSVLRRLQKQECDKDRSRMAAESEFQAVGRETAKLRDPYHDSRQRGILSGHGVNTTVDVIDQ